MSIQSQSKQRALGGTGITIPMDRLDDAVVGHLERKLFQTDRLCMLMGNVIDRREAWSSAGGLTWANCAGDRPRQPTS